ncbi:uncharacterized protein ARMOST_08472 [Armillaria ostoyae]|uniref:Uncharacterized protein n=1 Tax=Armillaria ostoyae TaxID=47428 RepID=A0A284R8P6_ARMOS|nr:uncharacterized protein ARMOST_08472 [Armillaria ostoyae]
MARTTSKKVTANTPSKKANGTPRRAKTPLGKHSGPASLTSHRSLAERVELLKAEPFVDMDRTTVTCIVCIRPGCDGKNVELDKRYPLQLSNWLKHCRKYHGDVTKEDPDNSQAGGSVGSTDDSGPEKENIAARLARTKAPKKMMTTRPKGLGRVRLDIDNSTPRQKRAASVPQEKTRQV